MFNIQSALVVGILKFLKSRHRFKLTIHTFNPRTKRTALSLLVSFRFSDKSVVCISYFTHLCHVSCLSHPPLFDGINNVSCRPPLAARSKA